MPCRVPSAADSAADSAATSLILTSAILAKAGFRLPLAQSIANDRTCPMFWSSRWTIQFNSIALFQTQQHHRHTSSTRQSEVHIIINYHPTLHAVVHSVNSIVSSSGLHQCLRILDVYRKLVASIPCII